MSEQIAQTPQAAPIMEGAPQADIAMQQAPEAPKSQERDQLISQMFANNAKLERELRELRQKAKQGAPEIDPELKKLADMKKKAKANPIAWLEAAGLTYDEITEYQLNGGRPVVSEEVLTLQEEIQKMRQERDEEKKRLQEEMGIKAREAEISKIKNSVLQNKEKFELVSFHDDHINLVKEVMEEGQANGQDLTVEQAAEMVEKHLEDMARQFASLPKLRKIFGAVDNPPVSTDNGYRESPQSQSQAAKTLTHSMTQAGVGTQERELTDDERRAKAAEMLRFL